MMKVLAGDAAHFHKPGHEPPKRLVPDPETAPIVRRAYDLFLETRQQAAVREYLNDVTPRRWTTTTVKNLLTNEVYKGILVFGQWRKEDAWEPAVEPAVWNAVQEAVAARTSRPPRVKADEFIYYLHGKVQCPHCGCPFTQSGAWGRSGRVHYYVCQTTNRNNKSRPPCPIGRVNAERVHYTVLSYMEYTATHRTVMHKLIAQSGGWGNAGDAQKALRGQLGKQKQALEMRIANYVKAIGDGRMSAALLTALDKVEAEKEAVCRQMQEADQEIASQTVQRPTAAQVSEAWGSIGRVWPVLTEEERTDLLSSIVQVVEVTEKESVTLELLPVIMSHSLTSHSRGFGLCTPIGSAYLRWCY